MSTDCDLVSTDLIGREQFHHQGAPRVIVSTDLIGREPSRDL